MPDLNSRSRPRRRLPIALVCTGLVLFGGSAYGVLSSMDAPGPVVSAAGAGGAALDPLSRAIETTRRELRDNPGDALRWAQLGSAYVEQARATADPSYYPKAQGALERSLRLQPRDNGEAMIGMGALANARHDFAAARDWAQRARALQPATGRVYGVLTDALTQLGEPAAATAAVQRMLDTEPGVAAFTRASYDLELHGRTDDAGAALRRALRDSTSPATVAFCRYYLGELAFNSGDVDEAATQYQRGLDAAESGEAGDAGATDAALRQGRAKVAAARGDLSDALNDYQTATSRVPLPQYLQEYGELLLVAGRPKEAAEQFTLFTEQQRLYAANGSLDDLAAAQFAADHADPAEALRRARAEWSRRHNVLVADAMAWALHVNGRDAEALTFADRAAALGWRNATFAYHRGMILAALGEREQARRALSAALATNPNFSPLHAPRARAALDDLRAVP